MPSSSLSKVLLKGTIDDNCELSRLRGNGLVLSTICGEVDDWVKTHIIPNDDAYHIILYYSRLPETRFVTFPKSRGLNINMMPFKLFDNATLPHIYHAYVSIINACRSKVLYNPDTIAYLTIHESDVAAGTTQRRPGIHIESPVISCKENRIVKCDINDMEYRCLAWGLGSWNDFPIGGIYMASSVANSTRVWASIIDNPEEVVDHHGGLEHLREDLGEGHFLDANELCWITDRTPHESVAIATDTHRQFFRLVVGKIDAWYSQHSTPNPFGVLPEAVIIDTNKFDVQTMHTPSLDYSI